jgi:hypothetical protein
VLGHVLFELVAGVGMPLASIAGPVPAASLWVLTIGGLWRAAGIRPASADRLFAIVNGLGLTAVVAHLTGWPHTRSRLALPWLEDCEGLGPELMRFYNPILYISGAACVVGLIRENRSAPAGPALLTLALTPTLIAIQHREFHRPTQVAAAEPGWWNRRLQPQNPPQR